jgi:hypothetical protein
MRMIMLVQFPAESLNALVRNGTLSAKVKKILDAIKPESICFTRGMGTPPLNTESQ